MTIYTLGEHTPQLPDGFCWIADTAQVMGKVTLGEDVGIWFGAVLRGDLEPITIGAGTNIQENSVVHTEKTNPVVIGKDCTIGHKAMIHGCTIGDNTLIGMSATVLNGTVIGKNCLIGAGSLVTEHKVIPDNSLVMGSPGRVVRTLDDEAVAFLKQSALNYVENAKRFARELKPIG